MDVRNTAKEVAWQVRHRLPLVTAPPPLKVRRTDQRAAAALVRMHQEEGTPVDPALKHLAGAAATPDRRQLTPEERLLEVENALSVIRAEAASAEAHRREGLMQAWETVRAALDGEV